MDENNSGIIGVGKGTGLSNEANASQSEKSWQGTGGSMANENDAATDNNNDSNNNSANKEKTGAYSNAGNNNKK